MATYSNGFSAGWLVLGSLKSYVEDAAFECNVNVRIKSSVSLIGRSVGFTARGTPENIARFKRLIEGLSTERLLD